MSIPLIAVSPQADWIVAASGKRLAVCDSADADKPAKDIQLEHNILALCVSSDSKWVFVASDDKGAAVFSTSSWSVVRRCSAPKKVSAACFTHDCQYVIVGDKFGDVFSLLVDPDIGQGELKPLLGHYCAIITSITATPVGVVASGDRDGKLRISDMPTDPGKGSWSIVSYCLGHTAAVTFCALCNVRKDGGEDQHVLVSGGLEGLVILWNWETGEQRCSMHLSHTDKNENNLEGEGGVIAAATEGPLIAVAQVQRLCFTQTDSLWVIGATSTGKGRVGVGRAHTITGAYQDWAHKIDDDVSKKICQHFAGWEASELSQYYAELHKKDYSWQEREDRKNKGRKRSAADAKFDTAGAEVAAIEKVDEKK